MKVLSIILLIVGTLEIALGVFGFEFSSAVLVGGGFVINVIAGYLANMSKRGD